MAETEVKWFEFSFDAISVTALVFVAMIWFIGCGFYCFCPFRDDTPLIVKNVIIPSKFRYRLFTHTLDGRINEILRHKTHQNVFKRICNLLYVYYENFHIFCSFWKRDIGTNVYQCDRCLFLVFHIFCIAVLSLIILFLAQRNRFNKYLTQSPLFWMFMIGVITIFIMQFFVRCISLSTPNRLSPETIELLLSTNSFYIYPYIAKTSH